VEAPRGEGIPSHQMLCQRKNASKVEDIKLGEHTMTIIVRLTIEFSSDKMTTDLNIGEN
jgi:hypothetical protein